MRPASMWTNNAVVHKTYPPSEQEPAKIVCLSKLCLFHFHVSGSQRAKGGERESSVPPVDWPAIL